jgi:enoyl-CoA hydratase
MSEVIARREGRIGRISLNRPQAIHALNTAMCKAMIEALQDWRGDPAIEAVLIDHAEGRGFCAGGDIRMLATSGAADGSEARDFFRHEYRLNHLLFTYPKTSVAFMDGVTMGGGVGISLPCTFRVATENTRFAMPETAIGLFPDVGGGWYLSRLEGRVGQFLALTGARLDGAECQDLGITTHYVPHAALDEAKAHIAGHPERIDGILGAAGVKPPSARISGSIAHINKCFASDTLEDILAALDKDASSWAETEAATLRRKSPQACKVALRLLAEGGKRQDFADEMRAEYAIAAHVVRTHDFIEGVRAVIIDKDNDPKWSPARPEDVSPELLDAIFAPLPEADAWSPLPIEGEKG